MESAAEKSNGHQALKGIPFSLRAPLLSEGSVHLPLAQCDGLWTMVKVYAQGGENALHQHPTEDHLFLVMDGEATFYDGDLKPTVVGRYHGMMIPKGALYYFHSSGERPLVMFRVGSGVNSYVSHVDPRLGPDGKPLDGHSAANKDGAKPGVPIPGLFFGDE